MTAMPAFLDVRGGVFDEVITLIRGRVNDDIASLVNICVASFVAHAAAYRRQGFLASGDRVDGGDVYGGDTRNNSGDGSGHRGSNNGSSGSVGVGGRERKVAVSLWTSRMWRTWRRRFLGAMR